LQYNLFSKEIPSSLGSCTNLELLELEHNYFSGSLPLSLGELINIQVLKLAENRFSGKIPSLGNMTLMKDLVLRSNHFEGSVSFGVEKFQLLEFFDISGNIFTGKLPTELGELRHLTQMYVQGNVFTGPLNMVFSQQPSNMSLINIDLSDNKFSGSVPYSVFQIPSVAVVALSLNCFQGSLPVGICDAKELQGASMDGLGAAHGCAHSYSMPFTNIALFNKLEGSIPNCVFSMPNLKFLHMSGNGLTGTLAQIPDSSKLEYIHIAHNQITSTIPLSYQEHYFTDLDLSYNKITGEYKQPLFVNNATSAITLEINRLSGTLDLTLEDAPDLNILRDNIYSCDHLPRNDPNYDRYTCGSTTLDDAYILLMGVAGLVLFFVTGIVVMRMYSLCYRKHNAQATCTEVNNYNDVELDINQKSRVRQVYVLIVNANFYLQCGEHFMNSRDEAVRDIITYCEEIKTFSMYVLLLSVICIVAIAPILVLKSLDQSGNSINEYVTHTHVYSWKNSVAFVTGELPAGLLLLAWFVSCSSFIAFSILTLKKFSGQFLTRQRSHESIVLKFARRFSHGTSGIHKATINAHRYIRKSVGGVFSGNKENEERNSLASATSSTELSSPVTQKKKDKLSTKMRRHVVTTSIGLMIFNTAVVSLVNGLYISYSPKVSTSTEVMLQFALGLFNVLYVICFVPALTLGFAKHSDAINVRLWLLLTNSLVIPCIVTAVTSPSCVQVRMCTVFKIVLLI
jgi:Leucine-rich repeat (LRR) protein